MNPYRLKKTRDSIAAQTNPFAVLDFAWAEINCLGGVTFVGDREERLRAEGYEAAISDMLNIIEQMGGQDPLARSVAGDREQE